MSAVISPAINRRSLLVGAASAAAAASLPAAAEAIRPIANELQLSRGARSVATGWKTESEH